MKLKIQMEIEVTQDDIDCIIEMAGYGIGYWVDEAIVKEDCYKIHEDEFDRWHELSNEDILRGVKLYIENGNTPYNILTFVDDETVLETGMIDSDVADMIIQYACFGEIIYG